MLLKVGFLDGQEVVLNEGRVGLYFLGLWPLLGLQFFVGEEVGVFEIAGIETVFLTGHKGGFPFELVPFGNQLFFVLLNVLLEQFASQKPSENLLNFYCRFLLFLGLPPVGLQDFLEERLCSDVDVEVPFDRSGA